MDIDCISDLKLERSGLIALFEYGRAAFPSRPLDACFSGGMLLSSTARMCERQQQSLGEIEATIRIPYYKGL